MNTKETALIIIFVALTVALDPVRIPSVYLLGVYYRFCEIPIVASLLLFGPKIGVPVAVLNVATEAMLAPGPTSFISSPFVLMLTLSMLLGVYSALRFLKHKESQSKNFGSKAAKYFVVFGALARTAMVPFVLYPLYRFLLPLVVGLSFSDMQILAMMPALMFYAVTFSLYTIPIGYLVARAVSRNLKVGNQL